MRKEYWRLLGKEYRQISLKKAWILENQGLCTTADSIVGRQKHLIRQIGIHPELLARGRDIRLSINMKSREDDVDVADVGSDIGEVGDLESGRKTDKELLLFILIPTTHMWSQ